MSEFRIEHDSMGEVRVPVWALYAAQTQRAVENFPISGIPFSPSFIQAVAHIKKSAATVNARLGLISAEQAKYIGKACDEIMHGNYHPHFPIDIFQTGSGTSTNMNVNEVIAHLAVSLAKNEGLEDVSIHPNDHVNFGQSSNDVIPSAIRVAACMDVKSKLIPALGQLKKAFEEQATINAKVVKTGRTHLMDAMPVTFGQVFNGYARQVALGIERVESALLRVRELPQGGTAVGTGINTHPEFAVKFAEELSTQTGFGFIEAEDHFEAQSTVDAVVELSAQLKTIAVSLMKIVNDLRWMNSGPNSGLSDLFLAPLQPGSSIMPGKVNPVIEESVAMVCAQVIGNDTTVSIAGLSGNFELNVMLPVVAHNVLESIKLLSNASTNLAERSVSKIKINTANITDKLEKNPILVTALNPIIGYDLAAKIAKKAYAENRSLKEVAKEMTQLTDEELNKALDPIQMTKGGFTE